MGLIHDWPLSFLSGILFYGYLAFRGGKDTNQLPSDLVIWGWKEGEQVSSSQLAGWLGLGRTGRDGWMDGIDTGNEREGHGSFCECVFYCLLFHFLEQVMAGWAADRDT
ncbi:hypothetical protein VTJ04DRAFT_51 [Mycothermus thermophilus]|uniref:uncharacterized protein n=1 Tax=Humicola insolens TaxID=85995 RepID=UPI003743CDA0